MPDSMMPHLMPSGHVYTSVKEFAAFYGVNYAWDAANKILTLDGKRVPSAEGETHIHGDLIMAPVRAMLETLGDEWTSRRFEPAF